MLFFLIIFNRGSTKRTNSSEILCLMFVYDLCKCVPRLILLLLDNLWFNDLHAEFTGDRLNIVNSPDVIHFG